MSFPATHNIDVYKDDTFKASFHLEDDGSDIDLTNWNFYAHIVAEPGDSTVVEKFSTNITDATGGDVEITMSASKTTNLDANKTYWWDLEALKDNGDTQTYVRGRVNVLEDITRV